MKKLLCLNCIFLPILLLLIQGLIVAQESPSFTLEEIKSYPFPTDLVASTSGSRIAWAFDENGLRNIYVAEGPEFETRRLTNYGIDDGQALSSVSISSNGHWIVYIKGGDFGSNWDDGLPVNPLFAAIPPKVEIWAVPFEGGTPKSLGEGESPRISPSGHLVAYIKKGDIWLADLRTEDDPKIMVGVKGSKGGLRWSPNDDYLAFQCRRNDHSYIGIYSNDVEPIRWIDPGFYHDSSPRWSPDSEKIVFMRQPGSGGAPLAILKDRHRPWQLMVADLNLTEAKSIWQAPKTIMGSPPTTHGRINLHWANQHIVFLSYEDGWPHLYSIPARGGDAQPLTPGKYMAEYISTSPDGKFALFSGNIGPDVKDIDRRHIARVAVDQPGIEMLTPGTGIEWAPQITGDGNYLVYLGGGPQHPPMPHVMDLSSRTTRVIGENIIPADFPTEKLVTPSQVIFKAPDGKNIHGTLFQNETTDTKKPAIIYVHGGPPRQMLLGWHYSSYYSNAYALNQYLANQGFVVLSVNYRLGIGYGYDFHRPVDGGTRGASEYQDIKAAGEWLAKQAYVDPTRIGIYGGSYGGYLTAMALGRDSDLFATGVDIHGVHDRTINRTNRYLIPDRYEKAPDIEAARQIAWQSSPVSSVDTWTSPVLIIHADDDRNVPFSQSTDLVQRLQQKGVDMETLVIVDDTHHFMLHKNQMRVNQATAEYLIRKLMSK